MFEFAITPDKKCDVTNHWDMAADCSASGFAYGFCSEFEVLKADGKVDQEIASKA